MKYCKTTTITHPVALAYPEIIEDINIVIEREGHQSTTIIFDTNTVVINLDIAEARVSLAEKRARSKSMDISFGAISADESSRKMVLVELRFNYENLRNVYKGALEEKIEGSKNILGGNIEIHEEYIFIFQTNLVEQAKNRFFRTRPSIRNTYRIMDINQLQALYFHSGD